IALHLDLAGETRRSESFQGLAYDGRFRLVRHQHLALAFALLMTVADGRMKRPIAVHHAGAHLLAHLTAVLLALKLRLGSDDGFDELALGRILKIEVEAFARGVAQRHFL